MDTSFYLNLFVQVTVGIIGSAIGGFVVYLYVMHIENKREAQEKRKMYVDIIKYSNGHFVADASF